MIKLFDITDRDFSSNGDAVLQPYKAIVHKEDNGEYYLELETDLKWADSLTANRIIAVDMPAGQQAFRIINSVQTGTKIALRANHVFYDSANYLIADSFAENKTCNQALVQFNNSLEPSSDFTVSSDITKIESYRPVRESFKTVIDTMLERWGGHLVRNNWDIQINESIAFDTGITIRYAKNLESIQVEEKWDDVVTKILPIGQDGILLNGVTPSASIYIEGNIDKYPIPFTKAVTFDQNFNSEDYATETAYKNAVIADLRKQAEEYLIKHAVPEVSYTIKAHLDDVYDIGNTIEVIDERLGLNLTTQVTAFDYDCISERFIEIVFGNFKPKLNNLLSIINGTKKFSNVSFSTLNQNINKNGYQLNQLMNSTNSVGSIYIATSASDNPADIFGGTWTLFDKDFKFQWLTNPFTFNSVTTTNASSNVVLNGKNIEIRLAWSNRTAISTTAINIAQITPDKLGLAGGIKSTFMTGFSDDLNAIGMFDFSWSNTMGNITALNWVTRSTSYPTTTGVACRLSWTITMQDPIGMLDEFCNKWYWKKIA